MTRRYNMTELEVEAKRLAPMVDVRATSKGEADAIGRRTWIVSWVDPNGSFLRHPHPDGMPVGYRRGQLFLCSEKRLRELVKNITIS